ncbi:MAG: radical SAM family heme chaperone HemW [Chloroflexota bacterium]|nr:radical SAM family heme chaperone HemW [Chloroflexota bacterium]
MQTVLRSTSEQISRADAGLYVHIPFCRSKCVYCDFNCYAGQNHLIAPYVAALCRELELYGERNWRATTLYLGGGTPSLLSPEQVAAIVHTARTALEFRSGEVTLEANPGSVDEEYFLAVLGAGVNRVSIGIQSFRDADLKRLARHHSVSDAVQAFASARAAGVPDISLDLIYGLPDQSLANWRENLDRAMDLAPEHVSLYGLVVEEGTPMARMVARGKMPAPDDDLMADMYELAHEVITCAGLVRYEVSNWALPGHEARHNLVYWNNLPYIGAGAGAHGYLYGGRYSNELLPAHYIRRLEQGCLSEVEREPITPALEQAETLILGLRLDAGVSTTKFEGRYGVDLKTRYGAVVAEMEHLGLLAWRGKRLHLTETGRLLSNEVFQRLLPE